MARYVRHITHDIIWIEHSPLSSTSYEDIVLGFYSNSAKNESCFPFKNKFGELYFINFFLDKPFLKKKRKEIEPCHMSHL